MGATLNITKENSADYIFKIADDMNYGWGTCEEELQSQSMLRCKIHHRKTQICLLVVQGWIVLMCGGYAPPNFTFHQ